MKEVMFFAIYSEGHPRELPLVKGELIIENDQNFLVNVKAFNTSLPESKRLLGFQTFLKSQYSYRARGEESIHQDKPTEVIITDIPKKGEKVGRPWCKGKLIEEDDISYLVEVRHHNEQRSEAQLMTGVQRFSKEFYVAVPQSPSGERKHFDSAERGQMKTHRPISLKKLSVVRKIQLRISRSNYNNNFRLSLEQILKTQKGVSI